MSLIILKFGGTSVGSCKKINNTAKLIKKHYNNKNKIIVVASAMTGVTDDLIKKSNKISKNFEKSEYDVLLSSGEQISCALLAGALINLGLKSRSWMSWQIPILTEGDHSSSRIKSVNKKEVINYVNSGEYQLLLVFKEFQIIKELQL